MAFDYTNYLEVDADVEDDFRFTNRAGTVRTAGAGLYARNTAGEWCLETAGSTVSSNTGASANPPGRSAYVYTESSSASGTSSVWAMKRNDSFDNRIQNVFLDIKYSRQIESASEFYIEYATVASPNETTDWTILETIGYSTSNEWTDDTFDFSGVPATATLWIRIRFSSTNSYLNDLCFSTWREYSVDIAELDQEGFRFREDDGSESAATWKAAQDIDITASPSSSVRLRILTDYVAGSSDRQLTLQYKRTDESTEEWRDI